MRQSEMIKRSPDEDGSGDIALPSDKAESIVSPKSRMRRMIEDIPEEELKAAAENLKIAASKNSTVEIVTTAAETILGILVKR